ncbi:4Fe-4S binding protein [Myxococcota bacterium]|nr:4Fe-4S binding protein [Myxococcota bacterium]MBU1381406.1 4Fe-4S binding protein [Myxococcota bacterium]MBU1496262.1 4Fe-4S binding protein [Myxococcota bacterium]
MKIWFKYLSKTQKIILFIAGGLFLSIILSTVLIPSQKKSSNIKFTVENSIREIAPLLGVTGKALARELGLDIRIKKGRPLKQYGIKQEKLDHAVEHLKSHRPADRKYIVFAALVLFSGIFLLRLGKPDNLPPKLRQSSFPRTPLILTALFSIIFAGFIFGKSPNPMESSVKIFKALAGLYSDLNAKLLAFLFFFALGIIFNKIVCGWACPFGALQEIIYSVTNSQKFKFRPPFRLSNSIRVILFAAMIILISGIILNKPGFVIFHYINVFNIFNFDFDLFSVIVTLTIILLLSFFTYRPFCTFICPFGLLSWISEKLSIVKIKVNQSKCVECGLCSRYCPTDAIGAKVKDKSVVPDCYSCGRCLNICPKDAITYSYKKPEEVSNEK